MQRGNLFWGFVLIVGGAVLLLNSMGFFRNIDIWDILWPSFFILLGIWLIVGRFFGRTGSQSAEVALEGASRGRIVFKHGAGRLTVGPGNDESKLLKGEFSGGIDVNTRRGSDQLEAVLSVPPTSIPWVGGGGYPIDWNTELNRQVPLSLEFNTGAGENNFDLTQLKVEEIRLQTGASSSIIRLPHNAGLTRLFVESGAASATIHVPENVAARIRTRGGLASFNINTARFPRSGDMYQSIDYDTASNKADIDIQTGAGSVDIP